MQALRNPSSSSPSSVPASAIVLTPLIVTIHEAQNLPTKHVGSKTDPFVVVEAGGIRSQTDVQRGTINPVWDQMLTLRSVFQPGVREELIVTIYHEDVFEDVVIGHGVIDISAVLRERTTLDEWLELLDERGRRAIGADVHIVIANGKAPPLVELCGSDEVTLEELERSITQEPAQCDEREVDEATGRTCLHLLLANTKMEDDMLSLLLKCNHKQSRVPDRHGTLPLAMLCKRYGVSEEQLTLMVKCHPAAARIANRFGKLPLHFLVRNPSLTKPLLAIVLAAYPGAAEAKDLAGNREFALARARQWQEHGEPRAKAFSPHQKSSRTKASPPPPYGLAHANSHTSGLRFAYSCSVPLHYLARNRTLSKDLLQVYLDACGGERSRAYADTKNKLGRVPLCDLVTSDAFTDQHLRVMLRVSEEATLSKDK